MLLVLVTFSVVNAVSGSLIHGHNILSMRCKGLKRERIKHHHLMLHLNMNRRSLPIGHHEPNGLALKC